MHQYEIDAAVDSLEADMYLPKRKGGLRMAARLYATRERLERAVKAVEESAFSGYAGDSLERDAIHRANSAEPRGFIWGALLSWLIPIVIEWAVKRWLAKRIQA